MLVLARGANHLNEETSHLSLPQNQVPFVHAEVFKRAFQSGADVMYAGFPNKEKVVEHISKLTLSVDPRARRCEDLSGDVFKQLWSKLRACPAWLTRAQTEVILLSC